MISRKKKLANSNSSSPPLWKRSGILRNTGLSFCGLPLFLAERIRIGETANFGKLTEKSGMALLSILKIFLGNIGALTAVFADFIIKTDGFPTRYETAMRLKQSMNGGIQ